MLLEDRKSQVFPTLTPHQVEFAVRFASGPARSFEAGESIFNVGDRNAGVWLVAEGGIIATRRDGLGREQLFATCGPGQFSGEVSELGGQKGASHILSTRLTFEPSSSAVPISES
jgi:thioredoxin reductase (NADPH)